jgi:hypothetical protein
MFLIDSFFNLSDLTLAASDASIVGGAVEGLNKNFNFIDAIKDLVKFLTTDASPLFDAIVEPCKVIAGLGAMFWLLPILKSAQKDAFDIDFERVIILFLLMLMFHDGAKLGRNIAFGNYAFIKGIDTAIYDNVNITANISNRTNDFQNDTAAVTKINNKLKDCLKLDKTKVDQTGATIPNPAFTACDTDLRNMISTARFKNPDAGAAFAAAAVNTDFMGMASAAVNASIGFPGWIGKQIGNAAMAVPQAILDGWRTVIAITADVSLIVSLLFFPIPLAFSFFNTSPLQVWFSSIWAIGFFKFALTILGGSFAIINAKLGASLPLFTFELAAGIAAPAVAGVMAAGGGIGLFKLVNEGVKASVGIIGRTLQLIRG